MECEYPFILVQYSFLVVFASAFWLGSGWLPFNRIGYFSSCCSFCCPIICLCRCFDDIFVSHFRYNHLWNFQHVYDRHFPFIPFISYLAYLSVDNVLIWGFFLFSCRCRRNTSSLFSTLMALIF